MVGVYLLYGQARVVGVMLHRQLVDAGMQQVRSVMPVSRRL